MKHEITRAGEEIKVEIEMPAAPVNGHNYTALEIQQYDAATYQAAQEAAQEEEEAPAPAPRRGSN